MQKLPTVYIVTNRCRGTLYTGVTSDLVRRVWEHRNDFAEGFSKKYQTYKLVWFEIHQEMLSAIRREKAIKEWNRLWKIRLIETKNPTWEDLFEKINGSRPSPG